MGARERAGFEAAHVRAAAHLAADQAGVLQRLDVLGGRGERDRERLGKLPDRALAVGEIAQHLAARAVAEGVEERVELRCL